MKKNLLWKQPFASTTVKILFLIACGLFFFCGHLSYKKYVIESMSNSFHGMLQLDNNEKIKINLYLNKDKQTAYIRLIQENDKGLRYVTAEVELNALLNQSIAKARVDLHERNATEGASKMLSSNRLVSVLLQKNNKQYFIIINKDDFHIPKNDRDNSELIFMLFPD